MQAVTNTRVSNSRIKIHPKIFNTELDHKLLKYTGKGLTFKGDVKVNGSIASGFSSDSYIETNVNLNVLNSFDTIIFKVKFKQNVFDSQFVNTLGSNSCRINSIYGNGQIGLCNLDHNLTQSTNTKISDYIGKWLNAETILDRKNNTVTYIYRNESGSVIGFSKREFDFDFDFTAENLLIGKGLNEYPAYNLEIDLLDTYVLANNNNNICTWNGGSSTPSVQRYMHTQIGSKDSYGYRMFSGLILILGTEDEQLELRPKNDPQLWQRDGNYVKTVFTTNSDDWRKGSLSTTNKGPNCVDEYKPKTGEYEVKYTFNDSFDKCWEDNSQNMFCPVGNTYGSNVGISWNQKDDCTVDIYLYNCLHLYAFAFNNFGNKSSSSSDKYSPKTKEHYEINNEVLMDKIVPRERAHYKEIVFDLN